jgi:hypothetical protein
MGVGGDRDAEGRRAMTFLALNRFGRVVRTFNALDLARKYQSDMERQGTTVLIRRAVEQQRRAA